MLLIAFTNTKKRTTN